jgi:hypothetical protein
MNTNEIMSNRKNISLNVPAAGQGKFCELWPKAKEGLELLQSIVKNPIAKAAIAVVIAAGDAVVKTVCV